MLNLEELEKKLDFALSQETAESLTNWLQSKRLKNHLQSFGKGQFENLPSIRFRHSANQSFAMINTPSISVDNQSSLFALAA